MSLATTVKESKLQRRMYTQKALWYRHNGDREGMRVCLNLSRVEVKSALFPWAVSILRTII